MAAKSAQVRQLAARIANFDRWSRVDDRKAATAPARKGFMARFEKQVDPDSTLPADERARRADLAMRAHMTRLALAKAQRRAAA